MKTKLLFLIAITVWMSSHSQDFKPVGANRNIQYDQFGRVVMDESGKKINYPFEETRSLAELSGFSGPFDLVNKNMLNDKSSGEISCDPVWQYAIMGTSIGGRSLNTFDIDNDGIAEIFCSAVSSGSLPAYGGFWYIMKYNSGNQQYEHSYISEWYDDYVRRLTLSDLDSDGIMEILIGFENGQLLIINSITKSVIGQISIPSGDLINDIQTGDADNDGIVEVAISDNENIYFYNPVTFTWESQIPFGCYDFKIGNVDEDAANEIITSRGKVIEYNNTVATVEWSIYNSILTTLVEISDIDHDNMKEIIIAEGWQFIRIYDANTQSLKFTISSSHDIHRILLKDINNDNTDEIIYGDGQWGSIHCIDATTQAEIWQIENPEHGITGIVIDDVDQDGMAEVLWGAGWTSTGPDYLFVAGMESQTIEWQSVAIDGPFYAVEISDVDNDGTQEIVTISYESESGYGSGILSVFDSETYELEWQSDGDFFYMVWTGIFDFEIADIDNDGEKEIIVAAGSAYTGKIWIVNGITKQIESSYEFNAEWIDEFYALEVKDIDDDGNLEIIAGNSDKVYVINPSDYSLEWTSEDLVGYYMPAAICAENIDADTATEIVVCKGSIFIIDGISHQQWQSAESNYTILDLYDFNTDGAYEIVAGTSNGTVIIMDGASHEIISSFHLSNYKIDGIQIVDLNGDSEPEIVFTSDGKVYFYSTSELFQFTREYAPITGKYNGLKVFDKNNDGNKEVFVGTTNQVMELSSACYECLWFNAVPHIEQVSCSGVNDGSISLTVTGGAYPYTYLWSTGSTDSLLTNLAAGTYTVKVMDNIGCEILDTLIVKQAELITDYSATRVSCGQTSNGSASVSIVEGHPPYHFLWNTGDTIAGISNLSVGTYSVEIRDAKNCTSTETIQIQKDTMIAYTYKTDITCFGLTNGFIFVEVVEGNPPYTYQWAHGATSNTVNHLTAGDYFVTVTDSDGCSAEISTSIIEPPNILTQISTTPDNPNTLSGEGTAIIQVSGGTPPYLIFWNDPYSQTGDTAINLSFGVYIATVVDGNTCFKSDTVVIDSALSIHEFFPMHKIKVYPNPTRGIVNVEFVEVGEFNVELKIYDYTGRIRYSDAFVRADRTFSLDLSGFEDGLYCVTFEVDNRKYVNYIEVIKGFLK